MKGLAASANSEARTGLGVARERDSKLSTNGPLLCIAVTTRDFSGFTAVRTIV